MPPDNGGYMVAGYVVTSLILVGYTWSLWRRARRVTSRELRGYEGDGSERAANS